LCFSESRWNYLLQQKEHTLENSVV